MANVKKIAFQPYPVPEVYHPIYKTDKPIILVTGGRGSGKSFNVSLAAKRITYEHNQVVLFARYTMTSAEKSVIPEFAEKIAIEGDTSNFKITSTEIRNTWSGSRLIFSGIKTSSGNQTANLKSIQGLSTLIVDEGEEWQNEEEYDTIRLSIRTTAARNRTIIVMNPCATSHFVYKKYIRDTHELREIDGVPVQISTHPDVCHVHTTYLDNMPNLSDKFLSEIAEIKRTDSDKYAHVVIGRWNDGGSEDSLFRSGEIADMFTNEIEMGTTTYITCDAARYGRDFCVIMVWRGWELLHTSIYKISDIHTIVGEIERLRMRFGVSKANTLVDADGVGGDAVKTGGYRAFHGGAKPTKVGGITENYKNFKSQCAFYLAEKIVRRADIRLHINTNTCRVDDVYGCKIKIGPTLRDVSDLITGDFKAIRYTNVDDFGKKSINDKDEQKELNEGRSPDFFDSINMRAAFDLWPKIQVIEA